MVLRVWDTQIIKRFPYFHYTVRQQVFINQNKSLTDLVHVRVFVCAVCGITDLGMVGYRENVPVDKRPWNEHDFYSVFQNGDIVRSEKV